VKKLLALLVIMGLVGVGCGPASTSGSKKDKEPTKADSKEKDKKSEEKKLEDKKPEDKKPEDKKPEDKKPEKSKEKN